MNCFFIDTDGTTILRWEIYDSRGRIILEDGRILEEPEYLTKPIGRIFPMHPDENVNIRKDEDGVYHWDPQPYPYHSKDHPLIGSSFKVGGCVMMPADVTWTCATCGRKLHDPEECTWEEWYSETECEGCSTERLEDEGGAS